MPTAAQDHLRRHGELVDALRLALKGDGSMRSSRLHVTGKQKCVLSAREYYGGGQGILPLHRTQLRGFRRYVLASDGPGRPHRAVSRQSASARSDCRTSSSDRRTDPPLMPWTAPHHVTL